MAVKSEQPSSTGRNIVVMIAGLVLGGLLGIGAELLLFRIGYIRFLINFIPSSQWTLRLFFGLILTYLTISIGAGIGGAITGYAIWLIDRLGSKLRYVLGSAWAFAMGQGILLIPMLLFLVFSAAYENGVLGEQVKYGILFGIFGLLYGLIVGLVLGFSTVRARYGWLIIPAAIIGFGIGAGLVGYGLRHVNDITMANNLGRLLLRLVLFSLAFFAPAGLLLGGAYTWIVKKRDQNKELQPSRIQTGLVVAASAIVLLVLMSFSRDIVNFITIRPGSTTTVLSQSTQGVNWSKPVIFASDRNVVLASEPALAVGDSGVASAAWVQEAGGGSDVYYRPISTTSGQSVNVSNSPESLSTRPYVAVDSADRTHIIWEESSAGEISIAYSRCDGEACTAPTLFSDSSALACAAGTTNEISSPAIAIDDEDTLLAVWEAGGVLVYASWAAGETPIPEPAGCVADTEAAAGADGGGAPRLAAGLGGEFALVFARNTDDIYLTTYENGQWLAEALPLGKGTDPDVLISSTNDVHTAWCGTDRKVQYQAEGGVAESIAFPECLGRPVLAEDAIGQPHLVWYAEAVENNFGLVNEDQLLYESIRDSQGWTNPAIVSQDSLPTQPSIASQADGTMHLAWQASAESATEILYAIQEPYECDDTTLTKFDEIIVGVIENGGFHPAGYQVPFCRNQFLGFIYTPNPDPEALLQVPTPNGGFDKVAAFTRLAQYELLFTTMMWDPADEQYLNPGSVLAAEIARLYETVSANPEAYPRGLTVRMLLGNYPNVSNLQWGDQIWSVVDELRHAGVKEMENPDIGWKLEVANYPGVMPHSHTKFLVIDGGATVGAGFNYGYLHLPKNHVSGKGDDLVDLALAAEGPFSQVSLATYDDMWEGANQLYCSDFYPADGSDWRDTCEERKATVSHVPEVLKYTLAPEDEKVYSLYRTAKYKEADEALVAAISNAEESIDILHVNFALELICGASIINPDLCNFNDNALPWMRAVMDAVEKNQVHVRVMAENSNMNGMENRVGMLKFKDELEKRGLDQYVEFAFYNGRVHAKSMNIDNELVVVGSQNLHYSSWGEGGLLEYSLATTSPEAIAEYKQLYDYEWQSATPLAESEWESAP